MPTPADQQNEDGPHPLRPPELSHHTPSTLKRRVTSNTFNKEGDDDAAVARTSPRVSPDTRRGVSRGYPRRPPRRNGDTRKRHRVGAGRADRDFSRSPESHYPGRSVVLHPAYHPRARATTDLEPSSLSHCGHQRRVQRKRWEAAGSGVSAPQPAGGNRLHRLLG